MRAFLYTSEAAKHLDESDILDIGFEAGRNNFVSAITGVLFHGYGCFLQYIEGAKADVQALMQKIQQDRRHYNVAILENCSIKSRLCEHWQMKLIGFDNLNDFIQNRNDNNEALCVFLQSVFADQVGLNSLTANMSNLIAIRQTA